MSTLHYTVESEVECSDNDVNNAFFVRVTTTIGGRNAIEEFLACGMYPLASGISFRDIALGMTTMSKVETSLLLFPVDAISAEGDGHFLAKVETDAKRILGNYGPKEHDVLIMEKLLNGDCLNWVFEQIGVPYAPRPLPGTEAF
jgi:hypothetical protein